MDAGYKLAVIEISILGFDEKGISSEYLFVKGPGAKRGAKTDEHKE